MNKKYWIVRKAGDCDRLCAGWHKSLIRAQKYAESQAAKVPGVAFHVLEVVEGYFAKKPKAKKIVPAENRKTPTGDAQSGEGRFTDNGDRTVTDHKTGLMWTKNASHFEQVSFDEAKKACGDFVLAGYKDWRLPEIQELESLIDKSQAYPALPKSSLFDDVRPGCYYWSATSYEPIPGYAWSVRVEYGNVFGSYKPESQSVWPVRSIEPWV